jgi:hypothetical protein
MIATQFASQAVVATATGVTPLAINVPDSALVPDLIPIVLPIVSVAIVPFVEIDNRFDGAAVWFADV